MKVTSPPNPPPLNIRINPTKPGSGLSSFRGWDNPDVLEAMNALFGIRSHERITDLEIDHRGITVRIAIEMKLRTDIMP